MKERTIFCLSNASTEQYDNSLSKFTNIFPEKLLLAEHDQWEIALESIGVEFKKLNFIFPSNPNTPHFIFLKNKAGEENISNFEELSEFPNDCCYSFPKISYNYNAFKEALVSYNKLWGNYLVITETQKQSYLHGKRYITFQDGLLVKDIKKAYIHEKILAIFGFNPQLLSSSQSSHIKRINLSFQGKFANEPYFVLFVDKCEKEEKIGFCKHPYYKERTELPIAYKPITDYDLIHVNCDQIESHFQNSKYKKVLNYFVPKKDNSYLLANVKNKEYFPLASTVLSSLSIVLTDKSHNQLTLLPGVATFTKFHLRKMNQETKILRVTSEATPLHPDNTNNKFTVTLPQKLDLRGRQWKVALTSICFRPFFAVFSQPIIFNIIFTIPLDPSGPQSKTFTLPPGYYTKDYIVSRLNNFFFPSDTEANKFLRIFQNSNGKYSIAIGRYTYNGEHLILEISKELLYFFGYDSNELIQDDNLIMTFKRSFRETIDFHSNVRTEGVAPPYLIVYADFLQPSIVGSRYSRILKILSVEKSVNYQKYEFEHLEFFKVETSMLERLSFEIRTHTGQLMSLINNDEIVMSLVFQK